MSSFGKLLRGVGLWSDYDTQSAQHRINVRWGRYNRVVDLATLNAIAAQQERKEGLLITQRDLRWKAAKHAVDRGKVLSDRADKLRNIEIASAWDAHHLAKLQAYQARVMLGGKNARLDALGKQIAAGYDEVAASKLTLGRTHSANLYLLNRRAIQLDVERGIFGEEQASKLRVMQQMARQLDVEDAAAFENYESRAMALAVKVANLNQEARLIGEEAAVRRAEIREEAIGQVGLGAVSDVARTGGSGSFTETNTARVKRGAERALGRAGRDTVRELGRVQTSRAAADAERVGLRTGYATGAASRATSWLRLKEGETALGRESSKFIAGQLVERARINAAGEQELGRKRDRRRAASRPGSRTRGPVGGVLAAERLIAEAEGKKGGIIDRRENLGLWKAHRMGQMALLDHATNRLDAAGSDLEADNLVLQGQVVESERQDLQWEKAINKWQQEELPKMPFAGPGPSKIGLLARLGAELFS